MSIGLAILATPPDLRWVGIASLRKILSPNNFRGSVCCPDALLPDSRD
jgi:hypothetical protein